MGHFLLAVCRQARQDALALLATCATSYGAAAMRPHLVKIWNGLRPVLTTGSDSSTAPDERAEVSFCAYSAVFSSKHEGSKALTRKLRHRQTRILSIEHEHNLNASHARRP